MEELFLGIDLGGTGVRSAAYNRTGQQVFKFFDVNFRNEPDNRILLHCLERILYEAPNMCPSGNQIIAWGLASPGPLNPFKGIIETPPNLKVRNFEVIECLKQGFPSLKGHLINDADAALLAEFRYGAARGFNHVVGVFAGTGLGSAVISHGRIQRGQGKGAEWSHTSMYGFGKKRDCVCGRKNCIESFVGTRGLAQTYCQIFKFDFNRMTREEIFNVSIKVHEELRTKGVNYDAYLSIIGTYTIHLLEALKNIVCVHNPECIILGGGIINNNHFLLNVFKKRIEGISDDTKPLFENLVIKSPQHDNPGTLGAAVYAMDGFDRTRFEITELA